MHFLGWNWWLWIFNQTSKTPAGPDMDNEIARYYLDLPGSSYVYCSEWTTPLIFDFSINCLSSTFFLLTNTFLIFFPIFQGRRKRVGSTKQVAIKKYRKSLICHFMLLLRHAHPGFKYFLCYCLYILNILLSKSRLGLTQWNLIFFIGPILFLYNEESLVSSNLNSKLFRFHCVTYIVQKLRLRSTFK